MFILFRRLFSKPSQNLINATLSRTFSHNLDYVERIKLLQSLKDNNSECSASIGTGMFVYFYKNRPFIHKDFKKNSFANIAWISYEATLNAYSKMKIPLVIEEKSVLLDVTNNGISQFALQLYPMEHAQLRYIEDTFEGRFEDMRYVFTVLPPNELSLLSKACSLLLWHSKAQFCPCCGVKNSRNNAGSHRICLSCKSVQYPSISPVAIVVIIDEERCLLVRQPRHPPGLYTAIAGFSEIGESLEDTVRREVAEEVGLEVDNIEYLTSQHWPFPSSSLMVGCLATIKSNQKINIDKEELEDAQWFLANVVHLAAERVKQNPGIVFSQRKDHLLIPPPGPIAHNLITTWLHRIVE